MPLTSLEIWAAAIAVIASMAAPRLLLPALGVMAGFWLVRWRAWGQFTVRTQLDGGNAVLALMLPITLWATSRPDITLPQVLRLLTGIGFYYAIVNWAAGEHHPAKQGDTNLQPRERSRWLFRGTVVAGIGLALFALVSVEWLFYKLPFLSADLYSRFFLLVADRVHPNVLAGSLVMVLPVILGVLLFGVRQLRGYQGWGLAAAVVGMGIVLLLTQSRGALLALGAVLVVLAGMRWRWTWAAALLAAVVGGLVYMLGGSPMPLDALFPAPAGIEARLEIWSRALWLIRDFPLTGVGMGMFGTAVDLLYPFTMTAPGNVPHAHNLFLQIGVDLGLPGMLAWVFNLSMVFAAAFRVFRFGRLRQDGWMAGLGAGLLGSQIALVVHGSMDAVVWGMVRSAPLVWGLWGVVIAVRQVETGG